MIIAETRVRGTGRPRNCVRVGLEKGQNSGNDSRPHGESESSLLYLVFFTCSCTVVLYSMLN
jgi:hypothetical protein